jgi:hypothetical protein
MNLRMRRGLVVAGVVLVLVITSGPLLARALDSPWPLVPTAVAWIGGLGLLNWAADIFPAVSGSGHNINTSGRDVVQSASFFGLGLATALSLVLCCWTPGAYQRWLRTSYLAFLAVLMSLSTANFAMGDQLLDIRAQALIDLVLVVLGLVVVAELWKIRPTSTAGHVLRFILMFLIVLQGVLLPGAFGLLWWLRFQGVTGDPNPAWISSGAAVCSAVIAVLNFLRSKPEPEPRANSTIIVP